MSTPDPIRPRILAAAPWIVVLAGVLVMTVLFVLATGYLSTDRRSSGAPDPVWPFAPGSTPTPPDAVGPESPSTSPSADAPSPTPTRSATASRTPARPVPSRSTSPAARRTSNPPPPAPAQAVLTGRYRVLDDDEDSFIGEVLVRNISGTSGEWTVELRFRDEVDDLRGFWVESAPRPTVDRSDGRYIFRGVERLAGGSSAPLRFHFERWGDRETPLSCAVNGRPCEIW